MKRALLFIGFLVVGTLSFAQTVVRGIMNQSKPLLNALCPARQNWFIPLLKPMYGIQQLKQSYLDARNKAVRKIFLQ